MTEIPVALLVKNINQGSKAVRAILDGHPEVALLRQDFDQPLLVDAWCGGRPFDARQFGDLFFEKFYTPSFIDPLGGGTGKSPFRNYTYESSDLNRIASMMSDWPSFRARVRAIVEHNLTAPCTTLIEFMKTVAVAQHQLEYPGVTPKVVFWHLHFMLTDMAICWPPRAYARPYFGGEYMHLFAGSPELRVIHLARDPRAMYASGVFSTNHGGRLPLSALDEVVCEFSLSYLPWHRLLGNDRLYLLKNEDIHTRPDETLEALARFMGITYRPDIMRELSAFGVRWQGNSFHGAIDNFDPSLRSNRQWMEKCSQWEQRLIERLCAAQMKAWGYQPQFKHMGWAEAAVSIVRLLWTLGRPSGATGIAAMWERLTGFLRSVKVMCTRLPGYLVRRPLADDAPTVQALRRQQNAS